MNLQENYHPLIKLWFATRETVALSFLKRNQTLVNRQVPHGNSTVIAGAYQLVVKRSPK
jgi:hypothetical protein